MFDTILEDVPGISELHIASYDHAIGSNAVFSWNKVLEGGDVLLDAVKQMKDSKQVGDLMPRMHIEAETFKGNSRPLIFVCHGLGGTLLKQVSRYPLRICTALHTNAVGFERGITAEADVQCGLG